MAVTERSRTGESAQSPFRDELTPVAFLERAAIAHAERTAVVDGEKSFTYQQWLRRARRLAHALRAAGIEKDDRVAYLAFNSEPLLLGHFGVPMAGAVIVAINTRLSAGEVAYILEHSGSKLVFFSPELEPLLAEAPTGLRRIDLAAGHEAFLQTGAEEPVESWLEEEYDTIAIDYTSGTTGRPKGVMYHHRGAYLNALAMVIDHGLTSGSTYLWTLPMFHCNGWCFTWGTVAAGAVNWCIPRIEPAEVWNLLRSEAEWHFCGAPTVLTMLVNDPSAGRLERPVRVFTAGAPPSPTIIAAMAELGFELDHVYGLTETYGPFTINVAGPGATPQLRARQGLANVCAGEVAVFDEGMNRVPADGATMGEVCMRGNAVMKGYFDNPEATDAAFLGGWFHSGDVGVMHADGQIELRDRKKDIIISGGENISTIEVEQAVVSHPAVMECAVIAVPDERWGEVPKAFVTLKAGRTATGEEIIEHVRSQIAHYKAPKQVEFIELPKTSTGKVQKFVLRDKEWSGREKRIN